MRFAGLTRQMPNKLVLIALLFVGPCAYAQDVCEYKIDEIAQDEIRGSIVVRTSYFIDQYLVYKGETRYDEASGSPLHVTRMIRNDLNQECAYLLHTDFIPKKFYERPEVQAKKMATRELLEKLKRLEGKIGTVKNDKKD